MKITITITFFLFVAACGMSIRDRNEDKFPEQASSPGAFESDMMLTEKQQATIAKLKKLEQMEHLEPNARKAISNLSSRWPNKVVYYSITSSSEPDRSNIQEAVQNWRDATCLTFQEVPTDSSLNHIRIFKGQGCYSYVGYLNRPSQDLSIGSGCSGVGTIMHELGHAIGFWHEQSRRDRDQYIRINFENILSGFASQFEKYQSGQGITAGVPYDVGSIMHYSQYAFTKNGLPTIEVINPEDINKIGNRHHLSFYDIKLANIIYQCNDQCDDLNCQNEGYVGPQCTCVCKEGFYGASCESQDGVTTASPATTLSSGITIDGCNIRSTLESGTFASPNYPSTYEDNLDCTYTIIAEENQIITLSFTDFELENHPRCSWDYLYLNDEKYCGTNSPGTVTSDTGSLTFTLSTDFSVGRSGFFAEYSIRTLDGTYTEFSEWTECVFDESCELYRMFRFRTCIEGPGQCFGTPVEIQECTPLTITSK